VNRTPIREVQARYSTVELFSLGFCFWGGQDLNLRRVSPNRVTVGRLRPLGHRPTLFAAKLFGAATGNRTQSLESTIQYFPIKL
jgi:hypothetical protein